MNNASYESPLTARYASPEMSHLFSADFKYSTWRKLWIALAQGEAELGLPIQPEQIQELIKHADKIDYDRAAKYEKDLKHDVMAHIHAYGDQCPTARPIIHLGATSCYVTDNADIIQMREGLKILFVKTLQVIRQLAQFAEKYADLACLGFTHFQPAQLTTVGKRACLWLQDFATDLQELELRQKQLKFLGVKGTTGTQASFLALFGQDDEKVRQLDQIVSKKMGFDQVYAISGQTYTRKQDVLVSQALSGIAVSAHKFGTDLRLLAHLKEIEEPFHAKQVGSSAMPYKRNPMHSERICSLSRFILSLSENAPYTAALQWLERTLDDSANRRLSIPELFLTTDAVLNLLIQVTAGMVVYPQVIAKHVAEELPFMATENILMVCVKKGSDRQTLHEKLRVHSQAAGDKIKQEGKSNDLLERITQDTDFKLSKDELSNILDIQAFIGRAPAQTKEYLKQEMAPLLSQYKELNYNPCHIEV